MTQHALLYVIPMLAIILGLVVFYGSKDRNATVGGYIFVSGFFILLWVLTFGGAAALTK
jgi:hypothetical protein